MSSPDNTQTEGESEGDSGLLDAPNQQVVRLDQSGPADEGEGGSEGTPPPAADTATGEKQQDREGSEPTRLATPDEQATHETPPPRKGRGRPRRDDDT